MLVATWLRGNPMVLACDTLIEKARFVPVGTQSQIAVRSYCQASIALGYAGIRDYSN